MLKIIFSFFVSFFLFFTSYSIGSTPSFVSLWKTGDLVIQGILPVEWRPLSSKEINALLLSIPENIVQQSGEIVSSFQTDFQNNTSSPKPRIIILMKNNENVDQEMIQKTFLWLKKNENLLAGIYTDKIKKSTVQDIEYKQKLPALLFQNNLSVNDHLYTELSSIIFLKKGILSIVCITDAKDFIKYKSVFHSFLESVHIPPALQHSSVVNKTSTKIFAEVHTLVVRNWKFILGIVIVIGIYGWVFMRSKEYKI